MSLPSAVKARPMTLAATVPPLTSPTLPTFTPPAAPGYVPPTPGTFAGTAPTATPYGTFTAPDPSQIGSDPAYQWRLSQGTQALQRGAAARGTLLNGGTQKALQSYGQGEASQEYQNVYNRALQSYGANRDTAQQNYGQQMAGYQGDLSAFTANTSATLGAGSQGLAAATANYDRDYRAQRTAYEDEVARRTMEADTANINADRTAQNSYAQQIAAYQQQVAQAQQQADYQRQIEADFQRQLAGSERQNALSRSVLPAPTRKPLPGSSGPFYRGGTATGRR